MQKIFKSPFVWIAATLMVVIIVLQTVSSFTGFKTVPTSEIITLINGSEPLKEVVLVDSEQQIQVTKADGERVSATWVGQQSQTIIARLNERVEAKTLDTWVGRNPQPGLLSALLYTALPLLLLGVGFFFVINMIQNSSGRSPFAFGKTKARFVPRTTPKTTFDDVAGVTEAVEELQEIKEFLAEPLKFQKLGAKIPKGVLLYGPPGTGKTLLARAVAGEAGVPFFSISGSDFVEMFVGVGASRVRDLFEQAKQAAPAIIFIDEIDAVGRHRGAGMGGGHDEREQTLNQLLVEMDGFDVRGGVILIAATNRPDVLDPALLRPGRFDRQIGVDAPDLRGREQILKVHSMGKPMAADVDMGSVARRTPGMTGADLSNVLNEAALLSARQNLTLIGRAQLDEAIDRVIAGPQRRSRVMNERERLVTAYHEGGHALVAAAMPGNDPVQKVTILPRGRALGYTMVLPDADRYSYSRGELLDQLAYTMGGRAAEELIFHDPTTGAANDIEKATKTARAMVMQYGMTERVGAIQLGGGDTEPFVGMSGSQPSKSFSERSAAMVDEEVSKLINAAHQEAFDVLSENREVLDELVRQLFEKETLGKAEVEEIFKPLIRRPKRGPWTGSDTRIPSPIPPVTPPQSAEPVVAPEPVVVEPLGDWAPPTTNPGN